MSDRSERKRKPVVYGQESDWASLTVLDPDDDWASWTERSHLLAQRESAADTQLHLSATWLTSDQPRVVDLARLNTALQEVFKQFRRDVASSFWRRRVKILEAEVAELRQLEMRVSRLERHSDLSKRVPERDPVVTREEVLTALAHVLREIGIDQLSLSLNLEEGEFGEPEYVARIETGDSMDSEFRQIRKVILSKIEESLPEHIAASVVVQIRR